MNQNHSPCPTSNRFSTRVSYEYGNILHGASHPFQDIHDIVSQ